MDLKVVDLASSRMKRTIKNNDWLQEFEKRAEEKLRETFDQDLQDAPPKLVEQLERLRQAEQKFLNRKSK